MIYIQDMSCISPQNTFGPAAFERGVIDHEENKYFAIEPDYKALIQKNSLRRMGKITRLGIGAGIPLLERNQDIDGIVFGTANGGLEDCVKFLDQIIKYDEGTLTPSNFVQSTANAVTGTLAIMSQNNGYNVTYVSAGLAFEAALLDALMYLEDGTGKKYLIGSAEEISDYNYNIDRHRGLFKEIPVSSTKLLTSNTIGSVSGEGASMFIVGNARDNYLGIIKDVGMIQTTDPSMVDEYLARLLTKNGLKYSDIETLIVGLNGDVEGDKYYHNLLETSFATQTIITFKNLVGEHPSVSSFALWLAVQQKPLPEEAIFRKGEPGNGNILIYNHYRGIKHGFIIVHNEKSLI